MKKLANHIILSGVTVSMLFSPLMALPSGGKFTHGTSGKIETSGNTMNITGTTTSGNHVIQWGGGFNIGAGERVNFKGDGQNYLNIANGAGKSTIKNILDAGGNNVFLINPNGVIIEKSGSIINANRFVASTSSMSNDDMWKFAKSTQAQGAAFSPVFKPNGGNVVNMGDITANSLLLQGNKVLLAADTKYDPEYKKVKFGIIRAGNINLQGNEVYVDAASIDADSLVHTPGRNAIEIDGKGHAYLDATGYYYNTSAGNSLLMLKGSGKDFVVEGTIFINSVQDWWHFAKGWNEKDDFRKNSPLFYRLTTTLDFKGKNFANYCLDNFGCTNMIIGYADDNAFNGIFLGQGHTLKNMYIDTTGLNDIQYVGIFGKASGNFSLSDLVVDYNNNYIKTEGASHVGGLIGYVEENELYGKFYNIVIKNIDYIKASSEKDSYIYVGGFAGVLDNIRSISNVELENIKSIEATVKTSEDNTQGTLMVGGFAGRINYSNVNMPISMFTAFDGIKISGTDFIKANCNGEFCSDSYIGGFAGYLYTSNSNLKMSNITLDGISNIQVNNAGYGASAGGFIGEGNFEGYQDDGVEFSNIAIKNLKKISANGSGWGSAAGFMGYYVSGQSNFKRNFKDIFIYFDPEATITTTGSASTNNFFFTTQQDDFGENYNNIFVYYKNGTLNDTYGNTGVTDQGYNGDELKQEFEQKIANITKPSFNEKPEDVDGTPGLSPYEKPDVEAIKDEKVEFQKEWYNKEVVQAILDDILNGKYRVSINKFGKIELIAENVNSDGGVIDLTSVLQSLDFLDTLKEKNSGFDQTAELKEIYKDYNKALKIKDEYVAAQEHLFNDGKNSFYETYAKYQKELEIYNSYVKEIEAGKRKINDPEYLASLDKINSLATTLKNQRDAVNGIATKLNDENIAKDEYGYTDFRFAGDFALDFVHNPQSPDVDNPNKPELPETDMEFKQTASLNLIGDHAIEEEESEEEIDETSLKQKGLTCIVSDNFKTMNPCIVGGL
ncbi:filamentous hemagglutinin N-terminal domain-containing protein [Campylobacter lari]|nr:filamentous hemagglutinin N-terminal domain-containing protein [Campylobacter lari]EJV5920330.1 filamentous hemagglutinin N-terminal domain-containing protein [Campylobacter lari]